MNNEHFHPAQHVPPLAHALHHWDADKGLLRYEYNGTYILALQVEPGLELGFRHGSDGTMQSMQYCQQIYVAAEVPAGGVLTITLNEGAMSMRPRRADGGEAILGRTGRPLLHGVSGVYDPLWDLLVSWHGAPWHWLDTEWKPLGNGFWSAQFQVDFSKKALCIDLRMHYYREHLGYRTHAPWSFRPNQRPIAGWCSWEAYRRDISQEKLEHVADFVAESLKPYGLQYLQVDDGYQKMPLPYNGSVTMAEGWSTCEEEKFPQGHGGIVSSIRARGLTPGIWTNANITNPEFPLHFPEDVIFYEGAPLKGEWIDYLYSCTPECLARQVEPIFCRLRESGYEYVKIDAIRHLLLDGLHECVRLGLMSNEEAHGKFRAYMEATRRGLGEDVYYLASWGEMGEVIGVADACRISMDANPTWAGIRMQLFESARWFHTQRILFLNDPDHVCVRTKSDWAKSVLSLISLSGELYMLSDAPEAYTEEKLDILRRTLPPLTTVTAETGPLSLEYPAYTWTKLHGFAVQSHETPVEMEDVTLEDALAMAGDLSGDAASHPFSTLWAFHLSGPQGTWCVMERVATTPLPATQLPLSQLGLAPAKRYLAFDFWTQTFLGLVDGSLDCPALALGHCQVVALQPLLDAPQLIASSRHVSMDAVSVQSWSYLGNQLELTLSGVPGDSEMYFLHLPEHMSLCDTGIRGGSLSSRSDKLLELLITFSEETAHITLRFEEV